MSRPVIHFLSGAMVAVVVIAAGSFLVIAARPALFEQVEISGSATWSRYARAMYMPGESWVELTLYFRIEEPFSERDTITYAVGSELPWFPPLRGAWDSQRRVGGWTALTYSLGTPDVMNQDQARRLIESLELTLASPTESASARFRVDEERGAGLYVEVRSLLVEWWEWWVGSLRYPRTKLIRAEWRPTD